jgi:glyoxylase-like metal-dependent hydrolase (beta-lactamase superfamily II)
MTKSILLLAALLLGFKHLKSQTPPTYNIYTLKFASSGNVPISELASGGSNKDSVKLLFMFWLIRGNGKNILVDAGFTPESGWEKDIPSYKRPDSVLLEMNIRADEITDIIMSHPHEDHIDGISLFPKAHIWIQKDDYNYFVGEAWQKQNTSGGFSKRDVELIVDFNIAGRVTLVDGDNKELFSGITVFTGSRHTYNSQYVLVQTGKDKVIIASDNIWVYYNLDHLASSPYLAGTMDTVAYVNSMKRMKTQASDIKYILPGHDAAVFARFPLVKPDIVEIK